MKSVLLAAAAAVSTLAGGAAAQAHEHGEGYLPPPPYASEARVYHHRDGGDERGFPLLGANAGVTVLGIHLGASGKLRIGLDEDLYERHHRYYAAERYAAPAPAPVYGGYGAAPGAGYSGPCSCGYGSW